MKRGVKILLLSSSVFFWEEFQIGPRTMWGGGCQVCIFDNQVHGGGPSAEGAKNSGLGGKNCNQNLDFCLKCEFASHFPTHFRRLKSAGRAAEKPMYKKTHWKTKTESKTNK